MSGTRTGDWTPPPSGASRSRSSAAGARWTGASCSARCRSSVAFLVAAVALAVLAEPARELSLPLAIAFVAAYASRTGSSSRPAPATRCRRSSSSCRCCCCCRRRSSRCSWRARWSLAACDDASRGAAAPVRVLCSPATRCSRSRRPSCSSSPAPSCPAVEHWPAYAAALAAQLIVNARRLRVRAGRAFDGMPLRDVAARDAAWPSASTLLLAPLGLLAALAAADAPGCRPARARADPAAAGFERERESRIQHSLELGRAYRGTALLLRDLLEEDDEYTGHHTEDVVELAVKVAEEMGLDEDGGARPRWARCCTTSARSPSRRDHQQARPARRRGVGDHEDPHGRGRAHAPAGRRPALERRRRRARLARALGRRRLSRRAGRRADPRRRPHLRRLRRLQRDDHRPLLPQGAAALGGDRRAARQRRHAVRARRGRALLAVVARETPEWELALAEPQPAGGRSITVSSAS